MKENYIEKIYAGWLAKIIGIRLGAPIEGWSYEKIKKLYGALDEYPVDYQLFAADDDSNGPIFFVRALEDKEPEKPLEASDVADALLNYAPYEHGFFWWGGYGTSTEHTAYLNLRHGIPAPESGSIAHNGSAVAEQIGGQIFIDCWGLVSPGRPDLAAALAAKAASVTHDSNGIYGGIFVAVCISAAFDENDIEKIIGTGLSYIPNDCEYTRAVRAVADYYHAHPDNWEACYQYIFENFGYDRYPGNCHIIPNICVMILSLLYGEGDFDRTLTICNRCGWDTDCNVGNVAAIMGVRCGLDAIADKWRRPINDFLACSSVVGSLNIQDIPYGALYMANEASKLLNSPLPKPWLDIAKNRPDSCHFEFEGSTHAMRLCGDWPCFEGSCINSDEYAHTGKRALKTVVKSMPSGNFCYLYKKTYFVPEDFHDSRYDPAFSPLVYSGQTIHASLLSPKYSKNCYAACYAHDARSGKYFIGEPMLLTPEQWHTLSYQIPYAPNTLLDEAGVAFYITGEGDQTEDLVLFADDIYFDGTPNYSLDFACEHVEVWPGLHREISQCTRLKGLAWLEDDALHLSCDDFGEVYTGSHTFKDYTASFEITPVFGTWHGVLIRVQGGIRTYGAALLPDGRFGIVKNDGSYSVAACTDFPWENGRSYTITVTAKGSQLKACVRDENHTICADVSWSDNEHVYSHGGIGFAVREGSHCMFRTVRIMPA